MRTVLLAGVMLLLGLSTIPSDTDEYQRFEGPFTVEVGVANGFDARQLPDVREFNSYVTAGSCRSVSHAMLWKKKRVFTLTCEL